MMWTWKRYTEEDRERLAKEALEKHKKALIKPINPARAKNWATLHPKAKKVLRTRFRKAEFAHYAALTRERELRELERDKAMGRDPMPVEEMIRIIKRSWTYRSIMFALRWGFRYALLKIIYWLYMEIPPELYTKQYWKDAISWWEVWLEEAPQFEEWKTALSWAGSLKEYVTATAVARWDRFRPFMFNVLKKSFPGCIFDNTPALRQAVWGRFTIIPGDYWLRNYIRYFARRHIFKRMPRILDKRHVFLTYLHILYRIVISFIKLLFLWVCFLYTVFLLLEWFFRRMDLLEEMQEHEMIHYQQVFLPHRVFWAYNQDYIYTVVIPLLYYHHPTYWLWSYLIIWCWYAVSWYFTRQMYLTKSTKERPLWMPSMDVPMMILGWLLFSIFWYNFFFPECTGHDKLCFRYAKEFLLQRLWPDCYHQLWWWWLYFLVWLPVLTSWIPIKFYGYRPKYPRGKRLKVDGYIQPLLNYEKLYKWALRSVLPPSVFKNRLVKHKWVDFHHDRDVSARGRRPLDKKLKMDYSLWRKTPVTREGLARLTYEFTERPEQIYFGGRIEKTRLKLLWAKSAKRRFQGWEGVPFHYQVPPRGVITRECKKEIVHLIPLPSRKTWLDWESKRKLNKSQEKKK